MGERRLVDDAMRYATHGTLPRAGGFEDQDPKFCAAVPLVEDVIATLRGSNGNS